MNAMTPPTAPAAVAPSAVVETVVRVFHVLVGNTGALEAAFARLIKRARRIGVTPIAFAWGPTTTRTIRACNGVEVPALDVGGTRQDAKVRVETRRELTLTGVGPVLDGWVFRATLQHLEGGNILRSAPVSDEAERIPTIYRTRGPVCDHCGTDRRRIDTHVLQHITSYRWTQVGSSCLADFLGSDKAGLAASEAEMFFSACALAEDDGEQEESSGSGGKRNGAEGLLSFLVIAASAIRVWGWISGTAARDTESTSTNARIANARFNPFSKERLPESNEADLIRAEAALTWAAEEITASEIERSDYLHNLSIIARSGIVEGRTAGIACSMIAAHDKALGFAAERAAKAARPASMHFGAVKARAVYTLTMTGCTSWDTDYGTTHCYRFSDQVGNVAIWKSSRVIQELAIGGVYLVKGTVKAHGEWKGTKQTQLTRCSVEAVVQAASMPGTEGAKEES
jgi:hypothetical protein